MSTSADVVGSNPTGPTTKRIPSIQSIQTGHDLITVLRWVEIFLGSGHQGQGSSLRRLRFFLFLPEAHLPFQCMRMGRIGPLNILVHSALCPVDRADSIALSHVILRTQDCLHIPYHLTHYARPLYPYPQRSQLSPVCLTTTWVL